MRLRTLASLLLASALLPPAVRAQEEQEEEEQASETDEIEITDRPGSVKLGPSGGGRESAPGVTHTVEGGDTLWDLSQRYLGNPWYWPKVWSYNPEIANPHWIYPGNKLRFFSGGEEVPAQVEQPTEIAAPDTEDIVPSSEFQVNGADLVSVSGKIGYEPKAARAVALSGFVTSRELEEAGVLENASTDAFMLSYLDTAFIRFKKRDEVRVGDKYVVFHTTTAINHPTTGRKLGYLTDFLGILKVVAVDDKLTTAQITNAWQPIERGDLVGPFNERLADQIVPRRNEQEVKGVIVTALVPYLTLIGEHQLLVVDKGSKDGVQVGNTFTVIRQTDLGARLDLDALLNPTLAQVRKALPPTSIATCLVSEVKEMTSNCLLTRSLVEVVPGDQAIMLVDKDPKAPSAQR
jgi:hypothetical protein